MATLGRVVKEGTVIQICPNFAFTLGSDDKDDSLCVALYNTPPDDKRAKEIIHTIDQLLGSVPRGDALRIALSIVASLCDEAVKFADLMGRPKQ